MNSLLEIISLPRPPATGDPVPDRPARDFSLTCRHALEEAAALGLEIDDLIDALRRHTNQSNKSN